MAKINPTRRAEIGREKSARTRAELVAAANSLFAKQAVESVTVDDVVREAGVAKGTFYVHFDGLDALTAAVAENLVQSFDEMLQSDRLSLDDPALRIAFGCSSFIDKALDDPRWASLVARMAVATMKGGEITRRRLFEDLQLLSKGLPDGGARAELNLEIVFGIMLQLMRALGEGRLLLLDRDAAVSAILRSIGLNVRQMKSVLARADGAMPSGRRQPKSQRSGASSSAA